MNKTTIAIAALSIASIAQLNAAQVSSQYNNSPKQGVASQSQGLVFAEQIVNQRQVSAGLESPRVGNGSQVEQTVAFNPARHARQASQALQLKANS